MYYMFYLVIKSWMDILFSRRHWQLCNKTYFGFLLQLCYHDNDWWLFYPDHPPEVYNGVRHRALCGDVRLLLSFVALQVNIIQSLPSCYISHSSTQYFLTFLDCVTSAFYNTSHISPKGLSFEFPLWDESNYAWQTLKSS